MVPISFITVRRGGSRQEPRGRSQFLCVLAPLREKSILLLWSKKTIQSVFSISILLLWSKRMGARCKCCTSLVFMM
jgi:hypothetical protein